MERLLSARDERRIDPSIERYIEPSMSDGESEKVKVGQGSGRDAIERGEQGIIGKGNIVRPELVTGQ